MPNVGQQINIGTPNAPLYVPYGSAGYNNFTNNVLPNIASGQVNQTGTGAGPNATPSGGVNIYAGQTQNPWVLPPSTSYTAPTSGSSGSSGSTGQGSQIVSSMLGPAYNNFMGALGTVQGQNQSMLPGLPQGSSYTISPSGQVQVIDANGNISTPSNLGTAGTAIQATDQSAQASIAAQVQQGQNQLSDQYNSTKQQEGNTQGAIDVALAQSGPGANTDVGGINYKASVTQQFQTALSQIQQAQSLLSLQGTSDEMAANATAANSLMTAAQNQINNTMQLAQAQMTASSQMVTAQFQGLAYDQQQAAMNLQVQQYHDQQAQQALQFTQANNVTTPYFTSGGQIYDSKTLSPVDPNQLAQMGIDPTDPKNVSAVQNNTSQQLITGYATAYPDAGIDPTKDTIATAQKKIQQSQIYKTAVTSGFGSSATLPNDMLNTLYKTTTIGITPQQYQSAYNTIQTYMQSLPPLSQMTTAQIQQAQQSVLSYFQENSTNPSSPAYGIGDSNIQALVQGLFSGNMYSFIQDYKTGIAKPNGIQALMGGGSSGINVQDSGSSVDSTISGILTNP